MKIAICYYGSPGWVPVYDNTGRLKRSVPNLEQCYSSLLKNLGLQKSDVDIFAHCWGREHENLILNTYAPVDYVVENQIDFTSQASARLDPKIFNFTDIMRLLKGKFKIGENFGTFEDRFRVWSRFYSQNKVVELKRTFEQENKFKYDLVILLRYDLVFFVKLDLDELSNGKLHLADSHDTFRQRHNYIIANRADFQGKYRLKEYSKIRKILCALGYHKNVSFMQHNLRHIFLSYFKITSVSVSDLIFIGTSTQIDILGDTIKELSNYFPCAHVATWRQISEFIGSRSVSFTLQQFTDFEILRQTNKYQIPVPKGLPMDFSYEALLKPKI